MFRAFSSSQRYLLIKISQLHALRTNLLYKSKQNKKKCNYIFIIFQNMITSSWLHPQSFLYDQLSWCAGLSHAGWKIKSSRQKCERKTQKYILYIKQYLFTNIKRKSGEVVCDTHFVGLLLFWNVWKTWEIYLETW